MENLEEILSDYQNKPNKDLVKAMDYLNSEFDRTKNGIITLTYHLDNIESNYNKILKEYQKRQNGAG